jgi:hypothetical protein
MAYINRELLDAYLDDSLSDGETARIELALRQSDLLRKQLRNVIQERDRGEHSIGAIWRRQRLTCPSREQLGSYLLRVLDEDDHDYITFHVETVACAFCQANLADLEARHREPVPQAQQRRKRYFESSADYLRFCREEPRRK